MSGKALLPTPNVIAGSWQFNNYASMTDIIHFALYLSVTWPEYISLHVREKTPNKRIIEFTFRDYDDRTDWKFHQMSEEAKKQVGAGYKRFEKNYAVWVIK